jgi:ABC-type transport system involved in multi-copper enzyme maturation permease subunit
VGVTTTARFTQASAVFDHISVQGPAAGGWSDDEVGGGGPGSTDWQRYHRPNGVVRAGDTLTVTGSGDIAPQVHGASIEHLLIGTFAGLITIVVVAVLFITSEYRHGMIRTTLTATPRRGRVLAAKALVITAVAAAMGLVASLVVPVGTALLRGTGNQLLPVTHLTEMRVMVGTAALLATAALFALGVAALLRRTALAVTTVVVTLILPLLLALTGVLPDATTRWLFRLTPAAGLAIQQSIPHYPQVTADYTPAQGFYPLPPWGGLAVLGGYAALALVLAAYRLRRRDA